MSYKKSSVTTIPNAQNAKNRSESTSSVCTESIFDDLLTTIERGDRHAKRSQKQIKKIKKRSMSKRNHVAENRSVYKSSRADFLIHNLIMGNI